MSEFQWKEGKGGLFLNRKNGPKFRGEIVIAGQTIKLAAWEKQTKGGDPWYSLNVDSFEPRPRAPAGESYEGGIRQSPKHDDYDDPLPF